MVQQVHIKSRRRANTAEAKYGVEGEVEGFLEGSWLRGSVCVGVEHRVGQYERSAARACSERKTLVLV